MKPSRKAAAQNERQNTTVQLSLDFDEAGDGAAETPEQRRQEDEQQPNPLLAAGWRGFCRDCGGVGHRAKRGKRPALCRPPRLAHCPSVGVIQAGHAVVAIAGR